MASQSEVNDAKVELLGAITALVKDLRTLAAEAIKAAKTGNAGK